MRKPALQKLFSAKQMSEAQLLKNAAPAPSSQQHHGTLLRGVKQSEQRMNGLTVLKKLKGHRKIFKK